METVVEQSLPQGEKKSLSFCHIAFLLCQQIVAFHVMPPTRAVDFG